jgi:hypothetical protein
MEYDSKDRLELKIDNKARNYVRKFYGDNN